MALDILSSYLVGKTVDIFPKWLSRRILPYHKIHNNILIELRSINPIIIHLNNDNPSINIYFEISNFNPIDIYLDRLIFDLWIRQPMLYGSVLKRRHIPSNNKRDLFFVTHLNSYQVAAIRKSMNGNIIDITLCIHGSAYFDTSIGSVFVDKIEINHQNVVTF